MPLPDFEESAETPLQLMEDAVVDAEGKQVDPKSSISNCYNQLWEAKGADAAEKQAELEGKINDLTEQIGSLTEKH